MNLGIELMYLGRRSVKVGEVKRKQKNEFKPQGEVNLLHCYFVRPSRQQRKQQTPSPLILFLRVALNSELIVE